MSTEFKPIETQEELDNIIKDRLARNTKTVTAEVTKKFEGYISPDGIAEKTADLEKQITNLKGKMSEKDNTIAELKAKNTAFEASAAKAKIAREYGIPPELADRISGNNEDEYKADAEALAKFVSAANNTPPPPVFDGESGKSNAVDAALGSLLNGLTS